MYVFDILNRKWLGDILLLHNDFIVIDGYGPHLVSKSIWFNGFITSDGYYLAGGPYLLSQYNLLKNNNVDEKFWVVDGYDLREATLIEKNLFIVGDKLEMFKQKRYAEIDKVTEMLISQGFEYPNNSGNFFSLSAIGQINVLGANDGKALPAFFPLKWCTKDDDGYVTLLSMSDMTSMFIAGLATVRQYRDSGTNLKIQIQNAPTFLTVLIITDNRLGN